jgi:cellulose synthase operon protein C
MRRRPAALGVLYAEGLFRAGDFAAAADAYGAVLAEDPPGVPAGALIFQRVLAEIRAGRFEQAGSLIDGLARDPRLDPVSRWQAEWNLARALKASGRTAAAYSRVRRLRAQGDGAPPGLPADLKARVAWLEARLAFDAGQLDEAAALAKGLPGRLEGVDPGLAGEIVSRGRLLEAETAFAGDRPEDALAVLRDLRTAFPASDSAVYSYLVEADYYASKNRLVDAQLLLVRLADEYRGSRHAPFALFQAAVAAERRGQDAYFREAYTLLERLVSEYPTSDLVVPARIRQGDLLRLLNQFAPAQRVYESVVNEHPTHGDVYAAQLALAACHRALSASDPLHAESALVVFERLFDLPLAPVDIRAEAGYQLGDLHLQRGDVEKALAVWWAVADAFMPAPGRPGATGPSGRYWVARALVQAGAQLERLSRLQEARDAYALVISGGLPGAAFAQSRLVALGARPPQP